MMTITEKAAYIKGLVEGMELDDSKKEVKVIKALVDIIDELALSLADAEDDIAAIQDTLDDMEEHIDTVDADLADVEEFVYEDFDCCGDCCDCEDDDDYDFLEDDDEDFEYAGECPESGKEFTFGDEVFEDDEPLTCPHCGTVIDEIEIEDEE